MEKDVGKIVKNPETDIIIRVDDFGGKKGLTIREYVHSERYTGFTKSGTRISAEEFENFKKMINSISPADMNVDAPVAGAKVDAKFENKDKMNKPAFSQKKIVSQKDDSEEDSGIDDEGLM